MSGEIKSFKRRSNELIVSRLKLLGLYRKALLRLNKSNFSAFMKNLVNMGEIIQKELAIESYHAAGREAFEQALQGQALTDNSRIIYSEKLNLDVFENAWRDKSLARLGKIKFAYHEYEKPEPNSCLLLWQEGRYKKIIPVNGQGQSLPAIEINKMDEVYAVVSKLTKELVDKTSEQYTIEENELISTLKRVLKQENRQDLDQTSLSAKSILCKQTRHRAKLGLECFKFIFQQNTIFKEPEKLNEKISPPSFQHLDEQACKAIRDFKTSNEKITTGIGVALAALTAFTYGTLEFGMAMIGFYVALGVIWSNFWLALVGTLLITCAALLPIPSTWTNWKVFSTYLPEFLNKIRSEYNEINTKLKKALFWGLSLFAFATGLAAGGLAYTSAIALPALLNLGAISVIFPPLGIFLGAAVVVSQTCMLLRNFCKILRKQDSWKAFIKPFQKVDEALKQNKLSIGRKIITWVIVGGLVIFSVLGLAMSCFTSTRSIGKFFIDQFNATPERALAWGVAISGVGSFLSRVYFTLDAAISSGVIIFKRLASNYFTGLTKLPSLPFEKKAAIATDTLQAGGFYAQSVLAQSQQTSQELSRDINLHLSGLPATTTGLLATGAFLVTSVRYFAINIKHTDEPEDPNMQVREQAANHRVESAKARL